MTRSSEVATTTTDDAGQASGTIRFTGLDSAQPWQLITSEGDLPLSVDFSTSTPIIVRECCCIYLPVLLRSYPSPLGMGLPGRYKVVAGVELGKAGGKVAYTFPLRDADLYTAPPGEYEQQDRTVPCRLSCEALELLAHHIGKLKTWMHAGSLQLDVPHIMGRRRRDEAKCRASKLMVLVSAQDWILQ